METVDFQSGNALFLMGNDWHHTPSRPILLEKKCSEVESVTPP